MFCLPAKQQCSMHTFSARKAITIYAWQVFSQQRLFAYPWIHKYTFLFFGINEPLEGGMAQWLPTRGLDQFWPKDTLIAF